MAKTEQAAPARMGARRLPWLRVVTRTAVYAVAYEGDVIVECAPYARPILRSVGRNVRTFKKYVEARGGVVEEMP